MPSYLIETFLARCRSDERPTHEARLRSAAEELTGGGRRFGFDGVIHVPEDETCFYVVTAPTGPEAAQLARRAGLDPVRVTEAVTSGKE